MRKKGNKNSLKDKCKREEERTDVQKKREDAGDIKQIASQCIPHPSGGFTEFIPMYRQVASLKEMRVCVHVCVWSNMAQLLQANCLALESETGFCAWMRVNENVPLCKIIFVPPKLRGGDLGE